MNSACDKTESQPAPQLAAASAKRLSKYPYQHSAELLALPNQYPQTGVVLAWALHLRLALQ